MHLGFPSILSQMSTKAMRGRGEGADAHELTGSITQASQKSLVGLALWRDRRGELEFSVLWAPCACTPATSPLQMGRAAQQSKLVPPCTWVDHSMKSKGQWLPPFIKMCSHLHAAMQITSLSFIMARAPPHARMQAWSLPIPSHARDRERTTAVNSFNWFQLVATAFSSLSPAYCWAAHWI